MKIKVERYLGIKKSKPVRGVPILKKLPIQWNGPKGGLLYSNIDVALM